MTVCIGALCEADQGGPQAVVVASDRMVTMGGLIEFEHEMPKGIFISQKSIVLVAGDALRGSRLARDTRARMSAEGFTAHDLAVAACQRYVELRQQQAQTELFTPRGIAIQDFYQGLQTRLLPQIAASLDQRLADFDYNLACVIAGVDDTGAHLYLIENPGGSFTDFEQIGFAAIGSGALHAVQSLIGDGHTARRGLNTTVFSVYASKRRAEVAPGVGRDTDLWIIDNRGTLRLPDETLQQLDGIYQRFQQPAREELEKEIAGLSFDERGGSHEQPQE